MATEMEMEMEMEMSMEMAMGSAASASSDLGYRPITLQFPLGPGAPPAFPPDIMPVNDWTWKEDSWDPDLESNLTAIEFMGTSWQNISFAGYLNWDPQTNPAGYQAFVNGEIQYLQNLMQTERERYLAEILAQQNGAPRYWQSLLGITRRAKPASYRVIRSAARIGEMAVVYYKEQFRRPRPSTVCPGLFPPFGPPGHPSFPSGHSTQSWLITLLLNYVAPDYQVQLNWLAERVAVNRERAGLHYPSDTLGGQHLANEVFQLLGNSLPANSRFRTMLDDARQEWP